MTLTLLGMHSINSSLLAECTSVSLKVKLPVLKPTARPFAPLYGSREEFCRVFHLRICVQQSLSYYMKAAVVTQFQNDY